MKKKLIYSTAIAALFSASAVLAGGPEMVVMAPSPFDGFYIGGSASFHHTGFDINPSNNFQNTFILPFTVNIATQNAGDTSTDAYFGVRGGWGRVFMNRYYAGVEGFAEFGNANGASNTVVFPNIPLLTFNNGAKVGNDYGVAAKLGILLSPTTLAYTKLGAEWANVQASANVIIGNGAGFFTNDLFTPSTTSSEEVGFLWGFGLEQFIWKDVVSLFAEYTYVNFGTVSTTSSFNVFSLFIPNPTFFFGFNANNSVKPDVSSFTGGLNVHFGRNWL